MKAARALSSAASCAAGSIWGAPALAAAVETPAAHCPASGMGAGLIFALLAGSSAAAIAAATLFYGRTKSLTKQALRQGARIDAMETVEADYRSLVALEQQACIIWSDGQPRLALHTLPNVLGVPSKLSQLLRFGSWLHPDDSERVTESLTRLQTRGEAFVSNASTLEGHVVEIAGAVAGTNSILRIRPFSPVNKELVRLIGENKRLKQALSDREKLLDSLPSPVWLRDQKGILSWVNEAYAAAIDGVSRDEVLEKQIELFETRQRAELHRLSRQPKAERVKLQTIVNGQVHLYEAITTPLERGSAGAAFDATPLAVAKDELDKLSTAHSRTLDRVSTGIAVFGADRKLVYGNDALTHIWQVSPEWLGQRPAAGEFFDTLRQKRLLPEQTNYRRWRDGRILAWEQNRVLDELWHRPDGRTVHVATDFREDGGITFLFDDVTEKLALERQYHSLIETQRETLDHLSEGIAVFGSNGRLQLNNPAFEKIWNLPPEFLQESPHLENIVSRCESLARDSGLWTALRGAITGMPEARDTLNAITAREDGSYIAYTATPLPDGGTLVTFADVTDSKRFEDVLLEKNEALEAADRLKNAFLSHVSYELRTPLTTIIGFTDLLAEPAIGPLNTKQRDYLNDIKTSSQVLLNIINDILDLAVIDAGALDLRLTPVDLREAIEAAQLGVRDRLQKAKIHLDVRVAKDAPTVMADENRLIQVLYNLLSNAIGFSPEDSTITLACRNEKNGISISVQDTGLGIPEEDQATVFERFESRSKGSRHRGAGLGLSLVKSIVELHKGRIDLRSTPGAGTTVTVTLPHSHPALHQKQLAARAEIASA